MRGRRSRCRSSAPSIWSVAAELNPIEPPTGWSFVDDGFVREFSFATFAQAAEFVARVGRAADEVDHHPEVALRYPGIVTVHTTSHDSGGVTARDVKLARIVDSLVDARP